MCNLAVCPIRCGACWSIRSCLGCCLCMRKIELCVFSYLFSVCFPVLLSTGIFGIDLVALVSVCHSRMLPFYEAIEPTAVSHTQIQCLVITFNLFMYKVQSMPSLNLNSIVGFNQHMSSEDDCIGSYITLFYWCSWHYTNELQKKFI
jgi:hypothetical protein